MTLVAPHGGALVQLQGALPAATDRICLTPELLLVLYRLGDGTLSPLTGFMEEQTALSVIEQLRLPSGLPWPIPILLPIGDATPTGDDVLLCNPSGTPVGHLQLTSVFTLDLDQVTRQVFGTTDPSHPGVAYMRGNGNRFAAGRVSILETAHETNPLSLGPAEMREQIAARGWRTVTGFQTRNVPHRAHEYLQRVALEVSDGLLIHPIVGWKKVGDYRPEVICEAYQELIAHHLNAERVIFSLLQANMFYAGPREALLHAIMRKNYGCSHFIVGRDHAGVGGFYDLYAAHRIFEQFDDLGVVPLRLCGPHYCHACQGIVTEKVCPHPESEHEEVSGTRLRDMLTSGITPPEHLMREVVANTIMTFDQPFIDSEESWK